MIQESITETIQFVSTIFLRPKKNGKFRMILNLKKLNSYVEYKHFKMDMLTSCINCILPDWFMGSIDLTDAYYSVPISRKFQKYLKFRSEGKFYHFTCMPNGLASAPRNFTKLLKPVFARLREYGHISCGYLDDIFLVGKDYTSCERNIKDTLALLEKLGFYINYEKSALVPSHSVEHLGFLLNSHNMTVTLNQEKVEKVKFWISEVCSKNVIDIRTVAKLVGILVACFPGVTYGQLFYRQLEVEKSLALKIHKGNFDEKMSVSRLAKRELSWWVLHAQDDVKSISVKSSDLVLQTDASNKGWGAYREGLDATGGRWTDQFLFEHINVLELKAAELGLRALCNDIQNCHILLQIDNVTAVSYIRNMGGTHSNLLNKIAKDIWFWCIERKIWLSATHIAGVTNEVADKASREFNDHTEWKLNPCVFKELVNVWGMPDVDMFASHTNFQVKPYVAWKSDPEAMAIDAFTLNWQNYFVYCFPPFSLIAQVLRKVKEEGVRAIMVVPVWRTQAWYPRLETMMCGDPIYLHRGRTLLQLPHAPNTVHPLWPKLRMMACLLSGRD